MSTVLARNSFARWAAATIVGFVLLIASPGCGRKSTTPAESITSLREEARQDKSERSGGKEPQRSAEAVRPGGLPSLETVVKRVTLRWTDKNLMSLSASASKLEGSEVTRKAVLTDFRAELYQNGKLTTTLVAPKVEADEARRTLTATGGVTLKSLDRGTVVKCAWVKWYAREGRIVGDGGVKVTSKLQSGGNYEMEGAAFEADTALRSITITDSARGWIGR